MGPASLYAEAMRLENCDSLSNLYLRGESVKRAACMFAPRKKDKGICIAAKCAENNKLELTVPSILCIAQVASTGLPMSTVSLR